MIGIIGRQFSLRRTFLLLAISIAFALQAEGQETTSQRFQVFIMGGAQRNINSGAISAVPVSFSGTDFHDYNRFEPEDNASARIAIGVVYRFAPMLGVTLRCSYSDLGGALGTNTMQFPINGSANQVETMTLEGKLVSSLPALQCAALLRYSLPVAGFNVLAGPSFTSAPDSKFRLDESIVSPPAVVFASDGSRAHTLFDGGLKGMKSTWISVCGGIDYEWKLNETISFLAEGVYAFPLTKLYPAGNWSISQVQLNLGILFGI